MHAGLKEFIEAKKHEYDTGILPNFITHIGEKTLDASRFTHIKEFIFVERKVAERKMETQKWDNSINDMRNYSVGQMKLYPNYSQDVLHSFNTIAEEVSNHIAIKTIDFAQTKLDQFAFDLNAGFLPDPGGVRYFFILASQFNYAKQTMFPDLEVIFFDLINIVKQGHLACFWDGKFPNGTLWVY